MATDRFLRFEIRHRSDGPDAPWLHWSDEPASQIITELREASEHGRYEVRALEADGTVVAVLPVPAERPATTDRLLDKVRKLAAKPWHADTPAAKMAAAFRLLDDQLTNGEPMPKAWQR